jgi:hypothetical protein
MSIRTIAALVLMVGGCPLCRAATVDMTGMWTFTDSAFFGYGPLAIHQTGVTLTICQPPFQGAIYGTIDPDTGAVHIDVPRWWRYEKQPARRASAIR